MRTRAAKARYARLKRAATLAEAFAEICKMEAPLNERLAAYADALRELNFPFAEAYDDLVARLKAGEVGAMAPAVGEPMPPFSLPAHTGRLVGLEEILAAGPGGDQLQPRPLVPILQDRALDHCQPSGRDRRARRPARLDPSRPAAVRAPAARGDPEQLHRSDRHRQRLCALARPRHVARRARRRSDARATATASPSTRATTAGSCRCRRRSSWARDGRVLARHVDPEFRQRMEIADILAALDGERLTKFRYQRAAKRR